MREGSDQNERMNFDRGQKCNARVDIIIANRKQILTPGPEHSCACPAANAYDCHDFYYCDYV